MATDTRGHTVPAADDAPARSALLDLSLSLRDPIPVPTTTARAQLISDLAALVPAIVPSTDNPIFVFRADAAAGLQLEFTTNGTTWHTVPATPRAPVAMASGTVTVTVSGTGGTAGVTFPAGRFTETPSVVVSKSSGALAKYVPYSLNATTAGCTIGLFAGDGTSGSGSQPVTWIASQG